MTPAQSYQPRGHRILVVEEEHLLRELLFQTIEDLGYSVDVVENGPEAVDALGGGAFTVAVVDTRVKDPDIRGLAGTGYACRPEMQFIAITPFADAAEVRDALKVSTFACLRMPFTVDDLESSLELACRCVVAAEALRKRVPDTALPGNGAHAAGSPTPE